MFDDFGNYGAPMGYDDGYYDDGYGYGIGYSNYKPIKATNRNVQDVIAMNLGCDPYAINFVKLDEMPPMNNWKHSCYMSGVTHMNVNQFIFDDGSNVVFAVCPFFPQCNKVHYYVERY